MRRRTVLAAFILCTISLLCPPGIRAQSDCAGFLQGVASGDPRPDSVVLWTRYTPQSSSSAAVVRWYISPSANITTANAQFQGNATATASSDFTVKVDVGGLQPATRYYYFFTAGNFSSLLGATKTAPAQGTNATLRFAQMSCASWRWGFFNVYNMTSSVRDLDFIVFLGDWIYEYGDNEYPAQGQGVSGRAPLQPPTELATLSDYRTRHRLFHTDPNLLEMMRRAPIIAVWDDHDVTADNAWQNCTANPVEGVTFENRKCNAIQAYHEYMPIRSPNMTTVNANDSSSGANGSAGSSLAGSLQNVSSECGGLEDIYRTFQFGNTMTLTMLEERVIARDEQYNYTNDPYIQALQENAPEQWDSLPQLDQKRRAYYQALEATNRSLIGAQQISQLRSDFAASARAGTTWQVLGNTVVMGPLNTPDVETAINNRGFIAQTLLNGILNTATSNFLEVIPASFGGTARVLVGTGRYHDPVILDGWSGYQYERNQILNILANNTNNPVVLSGDIHNAFVWRLIPDNQTNPVAIEFTTASVTAPGVDLLAAKLPGDASTMLAVAEDGLHISNANTMHFSNIRQRGAVYHTVNSSLWHADFSFVNTADQPDSDFDCQAAFELVAGRADEVRNATCTPRQQLFFQPSGAGDPLQVTTGRTPSLTTAAVQGTQLSTCPETYLSTQGSSSLAATSGGATGGTRGGGQGAATGEGQPAGAAPAAGPASAAGQVVVAWCWHVVAVGMTYTLLNCN